MNAVNPVPSIRSARTRAWRELALLLLILAVGMAVRLWALDALPPGLYRDEAANGLDALDILSGAHPLYFEANNGREPAFLYLQALSVNFLGRTPVALRLPSALLGGITILATYALARAIGFDRRLPLIAACLAATSPWMLMLSRTGLRAVSLSPLGALMFAALWRGLRSRHGGWMALAGLLLGAAQYTYLAARFAALAVLLCALWRLACERRAFWWRGWILAAGVALAVALPLGVYYAQHWEAFVERAAQVSLWNPMVGGGHPWRALATNAWRTALAFFYRGDFIARHNVPLRPVFSPPMAVACGLGLGLAALRARREPAWGMMFIWLGIMLCPTLLAEGAPHFLRASGILPGVMLFPALGIAWVWEKALGLPLTPRANARPSSASGMDAHILCVGARRAMPLPQHSRTDTCRSWLAWPVALAVVLLLGGDAYCSLRAFTRHLHSEAVYDQFEAGATELARQVNTLLGRGWAGGWGELAVPPQATALVARRFWRGWPSLPYLVQEGNGLVILNKNGKLPEGAAVSAPAVAFLWPFEDNARALATLPVGLITVAEGARERGDLDVESRLLYITVRADPAPAVANEPLGVWADGTALVEYTLTPLDGARVQVRLVWRASDAPAVAGTVFRHVICDGRLAGQLDSAPASGYYPRANWRAGDWVEDEVTLPLERDWSPGACQVELGWYDSASGVRLALTEAPSAHDGSALTLR